MDHLKAPELARVWQGILNGYLVSSPVYETKGLLEKLEGICPGFHAWAGKF